MATSKVDELIAAALAAADVETTTPIERAEMLVEIAMGLHHRPKSADQLYAAVELYERAIGLCSPDDYVLIARIRARMGTALQAIPGESTDELVRARQAYDAARKVLAVAGTPEELAEVDLNIGLVVQALASAGRALITDAIAAYQRALLTFDRAAFPQEYAILQNNLATAFLSIPFSDERSKMREALAVQSFEEGLRVVNLIDHPAEYAMLQNNLGNALQYTNSSHPVANSLRALDAYEEALKVRTRETTPLEYANTVANKANCLSNLPDDPERPEQGNRANLAAALALYREARTIFANFGEGEKALLVTEAIDGIETELGSVFEASSLFGTHRS